MDTHILIVCLNAVLPTFLLMAVGFAARRFKLLNGAIVIATSAACSVTLYLWSVLFKSLGVI